jgi:hypothetical protein
MLTVNCVKRIGLETIAVDNVSMAIVEDSFGNPLVVVVQIQNDPPAYTVVQADDPDFNRVLAGLGIDKVVAINRIQLDKPAATATLLTGPGMV